MKQNVGTLDKILRIVIGVALLALMYVLKDDNGYWLWGLIGLVPLATAGMGWCPPYAILGLSTCPTPEAKSE